MKLKSFITSTTSALRVTFLTLTVIPTLALAQSGESTDAEFARELKLVEGLRVYNEQLAAQLDVQKQAGDLIEQSIVESKALAPQIGPLLEKMISALDQFVASDLPFLLEDRQQSVARLRALMLETSVPDSERYRNIMDIYSVEAEYGQSYEAYPGEINDQPVDMLRIGRLALYAQTRDQSASYMFNRDTREWDALDASYNRTVRKAIKVASQAIAPELLSLPVEAPTAQ